VSLHVNAAAVTSSEAHTRQVVSSICLRDNHAPQRCPGG